MGNSVMHTLAANEHCIINDFFRGMPDVTKFEMHACRMQKKRGFYVSLHLVLFVSIDTLLVVFVRGAGNKVTTVFPVV